VVVCLVAMGTAALTLTGASLRWPLIGDATILHYVAARVLDGAVPYRDLFDMNLPGTYLVHIAGIWLLGYGDGAFRVLDLTVLGLTLVGITLSLARFGWVASATASLLFWLYHLTAGAPSALQRDYLQCMPLAGMTACMALHARSRGIAWLVTAGGMLGLAASVKPLPLVLAPVLLLLTWVEGTAGRWRRVFALAAGMAAAGGAVLTWVSAAGGLAAFLDIVTRYLPLYADHFRAPVVEILTRPAVIGLTPWAAAGALLLWRTRRFDHTAVVLVAGLFFGIVSLVTQGKNFGYHSYPFVLFAVMLGSAGLAAALDRRRWAPVAIGLLLLTNAGLARRGLRYFDASQVARDRARVDAVAALVKPVLDRGRTVQMFDETVAGLQVLYVLHAPPATRFLNDFHFFHHEEHPYIQGLRRELLDQLRASRPGMVVVFRTGQPMPLGGLDRIKRFPEVAAWVADGYRLSHEGDVFRVYTARDLDGMPAPAAR
jgi:hypothetical protein